MVIKNGFHLTHHDTQTIPINTVTVKTDVYYLDVSISKRAQDKSTSTSWGNGLLVASSGNGSAAKGLAKDLGLLVLSG